MPKLNGGKKVIKKIVKKEVPKRLDFFVDLESRIKKNQSSELLKRVAGLEKASIKELVDGIVNFAYLAKASDIHIEPMEKATVIRYRIDGILHDVLLISSDAHFKVITRIKVLSELRTDEHYKPQDGRFRVVLEDVPVDMRVSISPTYFGENAVMRLLIGQTRTLALKELGFSELDLKKIARNIKKSYGMIIATGPTGSGKTTTLYSIVDILNARERSIITIEDPIEYTVNGITQIQANTKAGLTFATGLRTIVRQDPNIIMVGEIRDEETAGISVNAAMTGHLLLSTLHTSSAAVTFPRLLDMGVEPFLIASTINVAIGQRLVRKLCTACAQKRTITATEQKSLAESIAPKGELANIKYVYEPKGCIKCNKSGYIGRIGIYEVLEISENIKHLIMQRGNATQIQKQAIIEGMTSMVTDGLKKVASGTTSIEEVVRVIHE